MGEVVFTSPHLFPCFTDAFKGKEQAAELPQKVEWVESLQCKGSSCSYLTRLRGSRAALVESLQTLSTDPARLDSQLEEYLSLACPLLPQLAIQLRTDAAASSGEHVEASTANEMDVKEGGEGPQGGGEAAGNPGASGGNSNVSRLPAGAHHGLGTFTWRNQLLSLQADSCLASCGGVAMDTGYLLLHTALWRWAKATLVIQQHGKHVPPEPVLQKLHIQPASGDLSPHLLEALQAACFADAQSLSLLRACSKENAYQSAGLIASIAHDTAGLYKCGACHTYALTFSALTGMRQEEKAGWAVRVAQEAVVWEEKTVSKLGVESDRSTKHKESERAAFDAERASQAERALTKLHRDNDGVYYKRVPAQMPDLAEVLPEGRRVVDAVPLMLPIKPPAPYTQDDVSQLLEDSSLASAKHKADAHPLPASPAPAARAADKEAGGNVEAHADSGEMQQGKDSGGQGVQAPSGESGKLNERQEAPSKKAQQGCCSLQ
ncbi:hypothetical protein DUNSADRAFT_12491 [Dunaliella salina]|uniref:BRO1 domain-containing protein n=1 Tax=Dunaliella salina TaxID=3046 RepID=A0ABQ7GB71_DUNSA|nr:hypothetical protein DUNSADRAFT_12491 [Dunaliella salina]|eukprot:KAF5831867.1 hypothetical protein DUNSADRAFT_12491 [Dunaliella salina]